MSSSSLEKAADDDDSSAFSSLDWGASRPTSSMFCASRSPATLRLMTPAPMDLTRRALSSSVIAMMCCELGRGRDSRDR